MGRYYIEAMVLASLVTRWPLSLLGTGHIAVHAVSEVHDDGIAHGGTDDGARKGYTLHPLVKRKDGLGWGRPRWFEKGL